MLNCAIIMGRLTADPELRTTPNGLSVSSFSVAVDRAFQRSGEDKQADFINVVAWRQSAEFVCKYFRKGSMIAVQGAIQTRNYEDKNGNKRTAFEIVADRVSFCGSKSEGGTTSEPNSAASAASSASAPAAYKNAGSEDFGVLVGEENLPF